MTCDDRRPEQPSDMTCQLEKGHEGRHRKDYPERKITFCWSPYDIRMFSYGWYFGEIDEQT